MIHTITRHWRPTVMFSAILGGYLLCAAPDASWQIPLGDDMGDVMLGATYLRPIHSPGFPNVALLGWLFIRLPGNDFWNMAVFSNLCYTASALFIFLTVKQLANNKYAPYIAAITFAAAPIVFGEAIASKGSEYGLSILAITAMFYFIKVDKKWLAAAAAAFGMGTHPITIGFCILLAVVYLKKPKYLAVLLLGLLPYLYIPLTIRPPYGQVSPNGFSWGIISTVVVPHVLGLATVDIPRRLGELALAIVSGLGLGLLVLPKLRLNKDTIVLGGYSLLILVYCLTTSYSAHIEYIAIAFAMTAILIGRDFERLRTTLPLAFVIVPLIVLGINTQQYDIGRTLDPQPTVARQYLNQIEQLPEDSIVISYYCHSYTLANYYECGANLNRVIALSPTCLTCRAWGPQDLRDRGVIIPERVIELLEKSTLEDAAEAWKILGEVNSERPIYWVALIGTDPLQFKIVPSDAYGLPDSDDFIFGRHNSSSSEWELLP